MTGAAKGASRVGVGAVHPSELWKKKTRSFLLKLSARREELLLVVPFATSSFLLLCPCSL